MGKIDNTFFIKRLGKDLVIVQIYVDDIVFGSTNESLSNDFSKLMHDEFEMSMMGELMFFLGLQIKKLEDGTFINQQKYIHEMIKKFGMENSKPMATPVATNVKLTLEGEGKSFDSTKYRGMIGSLLYLKASRPDIMFSVCLCARFQENPMTSHVEVVKRIFRYLKGTMHLGLWYPKFTGVDIMCFADSDHGGSMIDRKSTSGVCAFVGLCLTSWFLKKQTSITLSTTEAEYEMTNTRNQRITNNRQHMETRTLHEESVVHHIEIPELTQLFTQHNCFSFLEFDEVIYPMLIRKFYAHLDVLNPDQVAF
ncbi:uncharacterized mitochondrial protein AtMg00810-like [Rutidosis leptorrhynchoides]|uniref:uncharacterized mitochondrial protein AtMg00810-like n=1 Tax=Rutidosis leptorrhynchoides TaxID=125765 RepID=UPI003A9994B2